MSVLVPLRVYDERFAPRKLGDRRFVGGVPTAERLTLFGRRFECERFAVKNSRRVFTIRATVQNVGNAIYFQPLRVQGYRLIFIRFRIDGFTLEAPLPAGEHQAMAVTTVYDKAGEAQLTTRVPVTINVTAK